MNTVLRPVGPQPARVYWVRRLLLLLLVVGLVTAAAVATGATGDGDGTAAVDDGEAGAASTPDAPAAEGAAADAPAAEEPGDAAAACPPERLAATLVADAASYPAGATPTFTVTLTNAGDAACTVDAGLANQTVVVTSGADRIWSSADCPADVSGERLLLMAPGAAEAMPLAWPRVRSDEMCSADLPEPRPGTYTAVAVVAGVQSAPVVFALE